MDGKGRATTAPRQLPQRKGCHGHNGPVETSNHKSLIEVIAVSPTAMALVPTAVCLLLVTLRLPRDADARSPRGMIHENAKAKNKKKREPTRLVLWKAQINASKHFFVSRQQIKLLLLTNWCQSLLHLKPSPWPEIRKLDVNGQPTILTAVRP